MQGERIRARRCQLQVVMMNNVGWVGGVKVVRVALYDDAAIDYRLTSVAARRIEQL